jgi:hypothetical protein
MKRLKGGMRRGVEQSSLCRWENSIYLASLGRDAVMDHYLITELGRGDVKKQDFRVVEAESEVALL